MRMFHRNAGAACVVAVAALAAAGCGSSSTSSPPATGSSAGSTSTPASTPAGAPTIPQKTIKFGMYPCCADSTLPVVAIKHGFFKDVGITISPPNADQFSQSPQFLPAMQSKRDDMVTAFSTSWLNTLNTYGQSLPPVMNYDIYLGRDILMAPNTHFKSTAEFMAQGMSFSQAASAAVKQLKGQTVYTDPFAGSQPPYYNVLLSFGGLTSKDINFRFLTDDKTLALSSDPSRVPFTIPLAAPILVKELENGYKPLIDMPTILKYAPKSQQALQLLKETGNMTLMIQRSTWDTDPDTVLRMTSVLFRTIHYLQDPKTGPIGNEDIARAIDAAQGLTLKGSDIALVYKKVDPLFSWEQQKSTMWNPKSPYYVPNALRQAVQSLIDSKALPDQNYDLEHFNLAKTVFEKLTALQAKADSMFPKADAITGSAKKALVAQAHTYYKNYDFLDAVNYLKAAMA